MYLILKTISKINVHILFYLIAFLCIISGFFKEFIYITILIYCHELGHITGALYYKWNIDKIQILPFGGLTVFKECLNKPIKEEFIILILGPIYQVIFYLLISKFFYNNSLFRFYHYSLLLFNFLPIIPLDGSKLFNLLLNKLTSFKMGHIITIAFSFLTILLISLLIIYKFNLVFLLIVFFILIKTIEDYKNHDMIFNKFLLERFIYSLYFRKRKIIKGYKLYKIKRDFSHLFNINGKIVTEKEILRKKFDFKRNL